MDTGSRRCTWKVLNELYGLWRTSSHMGSFPSARDHVQATETNHQGFDKANVKRHSTISHSLRGPQSSAEWWVWVSVMRQSGGKRSMLNILIPAAIPKAPESTYPELKQMKETRASNKLTTHFGNDCIRSLEQLLKFWWFPLICQCVILIRRKVLNHSDITESSILNLAGLL